MQTHRAPVRKRVAYKYHPTVVRHIQPLMTINRDRVGKSKTFHQLNMFRRRRCPYSKGAINVKPTRFGPNTLGNLFDWIEGPGIHIARLRTDEKWCCYRSQHGLQLVHSHAALVVCCNSQSLFTTHAQHLQRRKD